MIKNHYPQLKELSENLQICPVALYLPFSILVYNLQTLKLWTVYNKYFGGAVMANLQVRLTDDLKTQADMLFASLGFDTSTAVRMFLTAAVEYNGLPFEVRHKSMSEEL